MGTTTTGTPVTSAARSGMADLIADLRARTEAGTLDYSLAGVAYWSDTQLQELLDRHRTDLIYSPLVAVPYQAAGSLLYQEYRACRGNLEETTGGTAIFYLQDAAGASVASSSYSADYRRGVITFTANQVGASFYLTGRSYDLDAAAADAWRTKAAHYANAVNFSTDNHSMSRAQLYEHCVQQAQSYEARSGEGIGSVSLFRSDTDG